MLERMETRRSVRRRLNPSSLRLYYFSLNRTNNKKNNKQLQTNTCAFYLSERSLFGIQCKSESVTLQRAAVSPKITYQRKPRPSKGGICHREESQRDLTSAITTGTAGDSLMISITQASKKIIKDRSCASIIKNNELRFYLK